MHTHIVFFWLEERADTAERQALVEDCHRLLAPIETVRNLTIGTPSDTQRPIVDRSYDFALVVLFDDLAGHDTYQDHPLHHEFVEKHKMFWKKCLVYDIQSP